MSQYTPLHSIHQQLGARLVDFAGWDMPLHYGSQIEEHHKVRREAGMFDVSHMLAVDIKGDQASEFLRYLLANDVGRLQNPGRALYTCMLNEQGGVIDDLITYYLAPHYYRLVVNAGTRQKDIAWITQQAKNFNVEIIERKDRAILAIQGPLARTKTSEVVDSNKKDLIAQLKPFSCGMTVDHWMIARTGYTGEDGLEIILPPEDAVTLWQNLLRSNVQPCGLGARDTLRLEAGFNLYGQDMDESISPLEANLAWTVDFTDSNRQFMGRSALEKQQKRGIQKILVGLVLEEKGMLRNHQKVIVEGSGEGEITSGSFSPTLGHAVALARVPVKIGNHYHVVVRDKLIPVRMVKPPFVRNGKKIF